MSQGSIIRWPLHHRIGNASLQKKGSFWVSIFPMIFNLFLTAVAAYRLCSETDYPYKGENVTVSLVQDASIGILVNGKMEQLSVSGSIEVVNGCSFKLVDFQILPTSVQPSVFGAIRSNPNGAIRLADGTARIGPPQTFEFVKTPGSWVSYYDFDQFRLFDTVSQTLIATANLPKTMAGGSTSPAPANNPPAPVQPSNSGNQDKKENENNLAIAKDKIAFMLFIGYLFL